MKTENNTITTERQLKLLKSLPRYLQSREKELISNYGEERTRIIIRKAAQAYPEILSRVPDFHTPMYDALVRLASKMAALKKGMKAAGISTEEFVRFNIEKTRVRAKKTPALLRKAGGKIYLSRPMRAYLKGVASSVTAHGWPTRLISGGRRDGFVMSVETRNCQMVAFWNAIGEGDITPYCTFFDFTAAELLGLGLKQVSSIDSGLCKYCFYKQGGVEWPESIQKIMN
jgi:hypothetical protein